MIVPNKFTSFDKSILSKLNYLLLKDVEFISVIELYKMNAKKFIDISEFILALDVLYVLGKIELSKESGMIKYVG